MVKIPPLSEDYIRIHSRMHNHLPYEEDNLTTILKGHLLIEEIISELVQRVGTNEKAIKDARLSFHQYACVAKAIYYEENNEWVWGAILKLNKIRNKLAHNLEPDGIEDLVEEFIDFCKENGSGFVKSASEFEFTKLSMAITDVHHKLWGILKITLNK